MRTLWAEFVRSRAFWVSYVGAGVGFVGCPTLLAHSRLLWGEPCCGASLTFGFPDSHMLRLDISAGEHRLEHLDAEHDKPQLVGTMDCHQMSDLFRWDEFQAVTRYLARSCEPAWAIELLFSFYVAVTPDIADEHAAVLRRSLEASEVFSGPEVEHILAYTCRVAVRQDFRWLDTPGLGWVAEGRNSYCMRHTRGGFDFARFGRLLAALAPDAGPGAPPDLPSDCSHS
jgi:hypothetical protein